MSVHVDMNHSDIVGLEAQVDRLKTDAEFRVNCIKNKNPAAPVRITDKHFDDQIDALLINVPHRIYHMDSATPKDWEDLAGLTVLYLEFKDPSDDKTTMMLELFKRFSWGEPEWKYSANIVWRFLRSGYREALASKLRIMFYEADLRQSRRPGPTRHS